MTRTIALGPGREFDVIRDLVARWGKHSAGIGDDAAVLDLPAGSRLVASTDGTIENVHFRRGWLTAAEIGYRAAAAALSDLAAMASTPIAMLVAMAIPESWLSEVGAIGDGIADAARHADAPIVGGNTTGGSVLSLTVTVLGEVVTPLRRDGARPGDALFVTGRLGGPLRAIRAWDEGRVPSTAERARFAHPEPRLREARWLAAAGARAAIDVSDGLLADLRHVAAASDVRMEIELERIPCLDGADAREALRSGEEYELAIAGPSELDVVRFARELGLPLTRIGSVFEGPGSVVVRDRGAFVDLPGGHDHLSV